MGSAYLEKVFLQIVNMSWTGIYCIIAVLLVRLLLKKQPKIFSYVLWLIVLFRLVCPVSFESPLSAFHMTDMSVVTSNGVQSISRITGMDVWTGENIGVENGIAKNDGIAKNGGSTENAGTVSKSESGKSSEAINNSESTKNTGELINNEGIKSGEEVKNNLLTKVWFAAEAIWLAGIIGMLIYAGVSAVLLQKKLKSAEKREGYYIVEHLETPFVFGLMFPRIYLPTELSEREITYILEHERTHIRRHDYLIKPLAFLVVCIHWFNPFVWLAFFCMTKDMEMSCDEAVLKKLGKEIKRDYSASLLNLACGRRFLSGSPLAFGEGEVKGRIKNILNYKKPGFWGVLLAVVVIIITGIALISNPKISEENVVEEGKNASGINEENGGEYRNVVDEKEIAEERLPVYQKEEEEQVKELLASYEMVKVEELLLSSQDWKYRKDVVFIGQNESLNIERWIEFYNHTKAGEEDAVLLVISYVEDKACLKYLSWQEGNYYMLEDFTRVESGSDYQDNLVYQSVQMPVLKELVNYGNVAYYLVDSEERTREEIESNVWPSEPPEVEVYPVVSFSYEGLEEILGNEVIEKWRQHDLEVSIVKAILKENEDVYHLGNFLTEAHHSLKIVETKEETIVYTHVLCLSYNSKEEVESGSYIPTAITFSKDATGTYELKEYWTPKDGSYYKTSIEEKFPEELWEDALNGQEYIDFLQEQCDEKAEEFFSHQE